MDENSMRIMCCVAFILGAAERRSASIAAFIAAGYSPSDIVRLIVLTERTQ